MSNLRARLRSELGNTTEFALIMNKLKTLLAQNAKHITIQKGNLFRLSATLMHQVALDPLAAHPIQYQRAPFASIAGSLVLQDLTFTGAAGNANDNAVSIAYTTGGTAGSEVVTVTGNAISIQIASGVSTATQIRTAFNASGAATALASCAISGTGSHPQTAPVSATNLAGGVTASPLEKYDETDVKMIRRLRTRKWLIEIKAGAVSK